jgi:hypothetical protein
MGIGKSLGEYFGIRLISSEVVFRVHATQRMVSRDIAHDDAMY